MLVSIKQNNAGASVAGVFKTAEALDSCFLTAFPVCTGRNPKVIRLDFFFDFFFGRAGRQGDEGRHRQS